MDRRRERAIWEEKRERKRKREKERG